MENVIRKLNGAGFKINNLFQLDETYWRCNVRDAKGVFFAFGEGKTPSEALQKAFEKTKIQPVEDFSDILD